MSSVRTVVPASCALIALALAGGFSASTAAATPARGSLTASGAFHGTWHQSSVYGQCKITPASGGYGASANLYYGVTTDSQSGQSVGGYPALIVTQLKPSGGTRAVNLATTENFEIELTGPSGSSWLSGWGSHSGSPPYSHLGSGTVSIADGFKSGTISTTLVHYTGSQHAKVHITASWNCR
jgi:hypothetical protein